MKEGDEEVEDLVVREKEEEAEEGEEGERRTREMETERLEEK